MTVDRPGWMFAIFLLSVLSTSAQQPLSPAAQSPDGIKLNVVVEDRSHHPETGLRQQDFTVLDNKSPRPIRSFKLVNPSQEPVRVILLVDAVNTPFRMVSYTRGRIEQFLRANGGVLAHPTTLAFLTDQGVQITNGFSTDGNAVSDVLEHYQIGLREITRNSEWSGPERLQICLNAFQQIVAFGSSIPGRKLVLWISPGWPLISGPYDYLDNKQEQQIFNDVVSFSTSLRQNDLTLYNINPVGVSESIERTNYFQTFLGSVTKPGDVQFGDLGIQVLAVHSGGLAIESNSDVTNMIETCLADARSWYEIEFEPLPADKPNEYHHVEIKLDQPGLVARSSDVYYSHPMILPAAH